MFNQIIESFIEGSELEKLRPRCDNEENPEEKESPVIVHKKKVGQLSLRILIRIFASFDFKFNMLVSRRISKKVKGVIETYFNSVNPERLFYITFKPGYRFPDRTYSVFKFINKVHVSFNNFYPEYHHWMFGEIFGNESFNQNGAGTQSKEIYVVVNSLFKDRMIKVG